MTEPAYLTAIRESYDTVATAYQDAVKPPAELDPLSRAMLAVFVESARTTGLGPVADLGCGPGHVTAHLAAQGLPALGVDISPRMIGLARRTHRGPDFTVGTMTALACADGSLGGILAYYSTHHTPPEELPSVYAEFHRTLAPGAPLMLAGYIGDGERVTPTHAYGGRPVGYVSHLLPPGRITEMLTRAGLTVTAQLVQQPEPPAKRRVGTFLAHRPDPG